MMLCSRGVAQPEPAVDQSLLDSREYRLDGGRLEQSGSLPLCDPDFTEGNGGAKLAGDGHQHPIRLGEIVGAAADDNGGPVPRRGLVGKGERPGTMSPNSKCGVGIVFRVVPHRGKGGHAGGSGGARRRPFLFTRGEEGDEVLNPGDAFGRQAPDCEPPALPIAGFPAANPRPPAATARSIRNARLTPP